MKRILFFMCWLFLIPAFTAEAVKSDKNTQLIQAAGKGNFSDVQVALSDGADINAKSVSSFGKTALWMASFNGHMDIVKLLLEKGAEVNLKVTDEGETVLIMASSNGHTDMVKLFLEKGADVNVKTAKDNITALWIASSKGFTDIVRLLLEKGADVNEKRAKYNYNITPLWIASFNGHTDMVKLLLEKGADVNEKGLKGKTALIVAAENGYSDIISDLLAKGADVNTKDDDGKTALLFIAKKGHVDEDDSSNFLQNLVIILVVAIVSFLIKKEVAKRKKVAAMPLPERPKYLADREVLIKDNILTKQYEKINPLLICPHSQEKGSVRTKLIMQTKGVSGGKAAAAVLTGGISVNHSNILSFFIKCVEAESFESFRLPRNRQSIYDINNHTTDIENVLNGNEPYFEIRGEPNLNNFISYRNKFKKNDKIFLSVDLIPQKDRTGDSYLPIYIIEVLVEEIQELENLGNETQSIVRISTVDIAPNFNHSLLDESMTIHDRFLLMDEIDEETDWEAKNQLYLNHISKKYSKSIITKSVMFLSSDLQSFQSGVALELEWISRNYLSEIPETSLSYVLNLCSL